MSWCPSSQYIFCRIPVPVVICSASRPHNLAIAFMFSVSRHIHSYSRHKWIASLKWKSCRWFSSLRYALAKSFLARSRLWLPSFRCESLRLFVLIVLAFNAKKSGQSIYCPSEAVRNFFSPKSKPTILPVRAGHHRPEIYSPTLSRLTVTVLTFPLFDQHYTPFSLIYISAWLFQPPELRRWCLYLPFQVWPEKIIRPVYSLYHVLMNS